MYTSLFYFIYLFIHLSHEGYDYRKVELKNNIIFFLCGCLYLYQNISCRCFFHVTSAIIKSIYINHKTSLQQSEWKIIGGYFIVLIRSMV
jgi:hypothetical protein